MGKTPLDQSMNLETLHAISMMVAQQRDVGSVLKTVVNSLLAGSDLALARIWLKRQGDICSTCHVRDECPTQTECLHLVASAARPLGPESGDEWYREVGFYQRFPLGVRRIGEIGKKGESLMLTDTADDVAWFAKNDWLHREQVKAFCGHPLVFRDEILGVLAVFSRSTVTEQQFAWLQAFADSAAVAIANANAFAEIESLKSKLELENAYLRDELRETHSLGGMIGQSLGLQKVLNQIELVAPTDSTVLIFGESGVGKELIARAIHEESSRADSSMIKVNCASIPRELFESEFFGHMQGSFTGATRDRVGRFELADGATLFLDEVGEIPLDMQSKLLRVLQEGTFERIGEAKTRATDVRVIAATNRDLLDEVREKRFRQDLYYRLSVFPLEIPPLRDRKDDIPRLAAHFLEQASRKTGLDVPKLRQRHVIELQQYAWPGNIRELRNVVERAVISSRSGNLQFHLPSKEKKPNKPITAKPASSSETPMTEAEMRDLERENLLAVLEKTEWKVSGAGGAAEYLGVNPATLSSRMRKMDIKRPRD